MKVSYGNALKKIENAGGKDNDTSLTTPAKSATKRKGKTDADGEEDDTPTKKKKATPKGKGKKAALAASGMRYAGNTYRSVLTTFFRRLRRRRG
jgi:hypothetical protein